MFFRHRTIVNAIEIYIFEREDSKEYIATITSRLTDEKAEFFGFVSRKFLSRKELYSIYQEITRFTRSFGISEFSIEVLPDKAELYKKLNPFKVEKAVSFNNLEVVRLYYRVKKENGE